MKAYTDIEQSKKLAEILPLESADMFWANAPITVPCIKDGNPMGVNIPCWSLAALLSVLPTSTIDSSDDHYFRMYCQQKFSEWHDNPIDATFEMICWLKENEKI